MSEIYVLEPPTNGKVIVHTSYGPLDIHLWSKEAPKACQNFVQLCLDGYYDGCIFHLIMKHFIVQTGDPTGTGSGGESIFKNEPFPLETHPRLLYRYRGLVGLASVDVEEEDDRDPEATAKVLFGSQFFITLAPATGLNQKNTLFGKVSGDSLYNLLNLAECAVDKHYRPYDPPRLKGVEVQELVKTMRRLDQVSRVDYSESLPDIDTATGTGMNSKAALQNERQMKQLGQSRPRPQRDALRSRQIERDFFDPTRRWRQERTKAMAMVQDPITFLKKGILSFTVEESGDEEEPLKNDSEKPLKNDSEEPLKNDTEEPVPIEKKQEEVETQGKTLCGQTWARLQSLKQRVTAYEEPFPQPDSDDESTSSEDTEVSSDASPCPEELNVVKEKRADRRTVLESLQHKVIAFKKGVGTAEKLLREQQSVPDADLLTDKEKRYRLYRHQRDQVHKKQKQMEVLEKLQQFQKKLRQKDEPVARPEGSEDPEDADWYQGEGLRFAVDSARAYEIDASKDALIVFDPLSDMTEEAAAKLKTRQRERLRPSLKRSLTLL